MAGGWGGEGGWEGGNEVLDEKCWKLEFHAGWSGSTRPPTMGGGWGRHKRTGLQKGRGGFKRVI